MKSKNEIKNILLEMHKNGITITKKILNESPQIEKQFSWLKHKTNRGNLRLDMYFPSHNLAVEYNGKQHYVFPNRFHENYHQFKSQQKRDKIKYILLKDNNINLIIHKFSDSLKDLQNKLNIIKTNPCGLYHDPH